MPPFDKHCENANYKVILGELNIFRFLVSNEVPETKLEHVVNIYSLLKIMTLCLILSFPSLAFSQSAFEFQLKNKVQRGQGKPVLILRAAEAVKSAKIKMVRSDGKTRTVNIGSMAVGKTKKIYFKQPAGIFTYDLTVTGMTRSGKKMRTTFETEVAWIDPIKLGINKDYVDLAKGQLVLSTNVALTKVDIEVYGKGGTIIHTSTQKIDAMRGDLTINWSPTAGDVGAVKIKATDVAGFWNAVILEPFFVDIPHQELEFETGKATWDEAETPKLTETLKRIRAAMKKHKSKGLSLQLYIAGYTDTVGSASSNMSLSRSRAKSIAKWFKKSGLRIAIYYQGFGEIAQAVKTADNVDEKRNRRAVYLLGNTKPPTSKQLPKSNWGKL